MKISGKRRAAKWILALTSLAVALDYTLYPRFETSAPPLALRHNAAWLDASWASGNVPKTASDGAARETMPMLAARLQSNGFDTAYFHVRYIGKSGRLRFRDAPAARRLNAGFKKSAPQIRSLAWLYIGNARGITGVDISKPETRRRIAGEIRFLTQDCAFDGVQIDYEICSDGDADFLRLLAEIRAATPGKLVSVATPMWLPAPLGAYGWSENYFAQVAKNCDEIAVMAYDSALYFPRHYVYLVQQQIERVPRAVKNTNPHCRVLLGVPSYEKGGASHWPYAENLAMGLRAARQGQNDLQPGGAGLDGIALFADYTTDAREWTTWRANFRARFVSGAK